MAWRIGEHVVRGELNNSRRNSVHGWMEFGGDHGIRVELTGNFDGDLAGRHIRFQTAAAVDGPDPTRPEELNSLEPRQIGTAGTMLLRMVRVPRCSIEEFVRRSKLGDSPPVDEKPCLYLEWYSQNGRVVAEIVEPQIEYVSDDDQPVTEAEPEPLPRDEPDAGGPSITGFSIDENGTVEEFTFDGHSDDLHKDDDMYGLFPPELEEQLQSSNELAGTEFSADVDQPRERSWDEVIPGIDEETKQMYEQWDEIFDGKRDEPVSSLFDPPLKLPPPDQLSNEADAEEILKVLLGRLAQHGVAIDVCEHFSARDTYRLLIEEILPEANIHPNLPETGFVQHYSTWESCPQCEAEFEEEYRRENPDEA